MGGMDLTQWGCRRGYGALGPLRVHGRVLHSLKGLHLALRSFNRSGTLAQQTVLIKTDNAAEAALVSRGGSQSADKMHLNDEVKDLFWYCIGAHITLLVEWIPREDNQQADLLSKFIDVDDWKVTPGSSST